MATIAEFTLPAGSFPLGRVCQAYPAIEVELERVVPTGRGFVPYFWVRGLSDREIEQLEADFADNPDVTGIHRIDAVAGDYLHRVDWVSGQNGIIRAITETDVVLLSGVGTATEWTIELRAEAPEEISAFQGYCLDHDLPVRLGTLHSLSQLETGVEYGLTDAQREALVLAFQRGYYESPRATTLEEMASSLGITGQSLGARLRRGTHRLIASTLVPE